MIEIKSLGTGVDSLNVSPNFFNSCSLTSLSARALELRTFSCTARSFEAKFLKLARTSFSTVAAALGAAVAFVLPWAVCGEMALLVVADGRRGVAAVLLVVDSVAAAAGVVSFALLSTLMSCFASTTFTSGVGVVDALACAAGTLFSSDLGICCFGAGAFSCDEMIAGSTGAPFTVV
jgi:hypothetical protein